MKAPALLLFAFLLVSGCAQQAPEENQTEPPVPGPSNQTPPASPPPIAPPQAPPPVPPQVNGNITEPPAANATNQSENATANETRLEGLLFGAGRFKLVLDDVSVVPVSEDPCGIFSVRNATDDSIYEKMLICTGDSQTWTSPDGHTYRIKVIKVAAGYSGGGNWVEVIIYG